MGNGLEAVKQHIEKQFRKTRGEKEPRHWVKPEPEVQQHIEQAFTRARKQGATIVKPKTLKHAVRQRVRVELAHEPKMKEVLQRLKEDPPPDHRVATEAVQPNSYTLDLNMAMDVQTTADALFEEGLKKLDEEVEKSKRLREAIERKKNSILNRKVF